MKSPKVMALTILFVLTAIALFQNAKTIDVNFFFWSFSASAFIMYLIFFALGAAVALIAMFWRKI
ncbi:MAG: lipopolysaccharide assembly protein LapA domain-containing protein [Deltaproteobacteria bacterium]